jgi:selenide, water dikinase
VGQDDLRALLATLPTTALTSSLLVGHATSDDAAVLRIDGTRVLVQTVDFFTPVVDDPELFGEIAAANAISDIYAMGAEPILGLALAMFPTDVLPMEVLGAILRGGARKAEEAGFPIGGGHTIIDDIPKYGLAVTGIAEADQIVRNSTASAGDLLYLTKPIGNGIVISAHRAATLAGPIRRLFSARGPDLDQAIEFMRQLNRDAARLMVQGGASAATDITGYGLIGHLLEMCEGSGVGAIVENSAVPLLDRARDLAEAGYAPAGTLRNCDTFRSKVESKLGETEYRLLCDAQTSGGLLIAVPAGRADAFEALFERNGVFLRRIGELTGRRGIVELS